MISLKFQFFARFLILLKFLLFYSQSIFCTKSLCLFFKQCQFQFFDTNAAYIHNLSYQFSIIMKFRTQMPVQQKTSEFIDCKIGKESDQRQQESGNKKKIRFSLENKQFINLDSSSPYDYEYLAFISDISSSNEDFGNFSLPQEMVQEKEKNFIQEFNKRPPLHGSGQDQNLFLSTYYKSKHWYELPNKNQLKQIMIKRSSIRRITESQKEYYESPQKEKKRKAQDPDFSQKLWPKKKPKYLKKGEKKADTNCPHNTYAQLCQKLKKCLLSLQRGAKREFYVKQKLLQDLSDSKKSLQLIVRQPSLREPLEEIFERGIWMAQILKGVAKQKQMAQNIRVLEMYKQVFKNQKYGVYNEINS